MLTGSFGIDMLINSFGNKQNKENMENEGTTKTSGTGIGGIIFNLLIGIAAAYLSWKCGEKANNTIGYRVFNAIVAYIFGILYLILYPMKIGCCYN